jgi:hypothetical protein
VGVDLAKEEESVVVLDYVSFYELLKKNMIQESCRRGVI